MSEIHYVNITIYDIPNDLFYGFSEKGNSISNI